MTPERWQQIKTTLAGALDRDDTRERVAFMEQACGEDADLREKVQSLLDQPDDEFDVFADTLGLTIVESAEPRRLGAYELVRELGRGGMGTVWLARRADRQFEKLVAIKLLKRGTDTDEVISRFHAERQILARLEHPNIARLLDAGTTDNHLPYFVMEYVEGARLTNFVQERKLSLGETLRLFLKICDAVQFAHQNLVVHRDLKPGNILVTTEGEPKLLDFGVAKLLAPGDDALLVTLPGHERFTPAYASPEQVRGDAITTLSDVYSAGALLYEMLAGETAHRFSTPHPPPTELLRVVGEQEPMRPSAVASDLTIKRRLRGDLDNIVIKALRKEPARRYPSMGAFAEDIRRYLADRPVSARRDTLSYRASKFVQRNKLGVAAGSLVLLTLIAGIVGTTWQARVARERFNDVRQLAHSVLFDYHDAIADLPGSTPVRKKLVSDSLQYLDRLDKQSARDPALQHEIASAYVKVGHVQGRANYANLGDTAGALASYGKAIELFDKLAAAQPDDAELQAERATVYACLGELRRQLGELPAAVAANRKAVAIVESVPADRASANVREALAFACITLGDVLGNQNTNNLGDAPGATENYRRALAIREELRAADPDNAERASAASTAHGRLGQMLRAANDNQGALEQHRMSLAIDEALLARDPNNAFYQRAVALDSQLVAPFLLETGDLEGARALQAKSIALWEQRLNADPQNALAKWDLALGYSRMVRVAGKCGDLPETRHAFERSLALNSELLAKEPSNATYLMTSRATYMRMTDALNELAQPNEAVVCATKMLQVGDKLLAIGSTVDARRNQADARGQRGKAYMLVAADTTKPRAEQEQNWRAARTDFQERLKLLETIPPERWLPMDQERRDEAVAAITKCDAMLAAQSP